MFYEALNALATDIGLGVELGQINAWLGLPASLAVFGNDIGKDTTTHIELGSQAHEFWLRCSNEVIQDAVGDGFMEAALVAE